MPTRGFVKPTNEIAQIIQITLDNLEIEYRFFDTRDNMGQFRIPLTCPKCNQEYDIKIDVYTGGITFNSNLGSFEDYINIDSMTDPEFSLKEQMNLFIDLYSRWCDRCKPGNAYYKWIDSMRPIKRYRCFCGKRTEIDE